MGIYAIWVTAISTVVIAAFTGINLWLISKIKSRDEDFRLNIILSSLISAAGTIDLNTLKRRIELFNEGQPEIEKLFRSNKGG